MTEDELKQLITWLESPTAKKYQSLAVELRNNFSQKLVAEMPPILDPKLMALDGRIRVILGVPPAGRAGRDRAAPRRPGRPASSGAPNARIVAAVRLPTSSRCAGASTRSTASCSACSTGAPKSRRRSARSSAPRARRRFGPSAKRR